MERIFYDANGNIVKKVQPTDYDPAADDGPGYAYEYDEVNRLVQITAPNGVVEKRYVYNLRGDIVKLIDAAGYLSGDRDETRIGTLYRYNSAGWLMEKREPVDKGSDGSIRYRLTEYRHDKAGNVIEERRYQDGQTVESAAGPVLSIFFAYDENSRLVQVSDSTGAAVEYGYNSINQRTKEKRRLSDGLYQIFLWKYDAAGRMVEQSSSIDRPDGGQCFATTTYSYDKSGNITRIQTATGGEILREYDAVDRLIAETHREKASGIHNRTLFSYDKAGNLVGITDSLGRRTVIEYDLLNREIRRIEKDGSVTRSFYDGNGRLSKVVRPNQYNAQADDGAGYQYTTGSRYRPAAALPRSWSTTHGATLWAWWTATRTAPPTVWTAGAVSSASPRPMAPLSSTPMTAPGTWSAPPTARVTPRCMSMAGQASLPLSRTPPASGSCTAMTPRAAWCVRPTATA